MSIILPKTASFGGSHTGLVGTVGIAILNADGTVHTARATAGIYEIGGGCYGKEVTFADDFEGLLKWDTGGGSPVYAVEEYLYGVNVIQVSGDSSAADNLDVAVSTRSSHADPTSGIKGTSNKDLTQVFDNERGTDGAYTGIPPTEAQIRAEIEGVGTKLTLALEDTDDLQTNQGDWATAVTTALSAQGKLDVNSECDTALSDYGANTTTPPTEAQIRVEMDTNSTKMAPSQTLDDYKADVPAGWDELRSAHVVPGSFGEGVATLMSDTAELTDEIGGRWEITGNQLIIYKSDNLTEVRRFNLFNAAGNPAMTNVYKRERV